MNKIKIPFIVFLIICIILPVLFTLKQMRTLVSQWSETNSLTMSISCGIASASEIANFAITKYNELIKLADIRMYEDKTQFYKNIGIDQGCSN